jgi:hypothetical protein
MTTSNPTPIKRIADKKRSMGILVTENMIMWAFRYALGRRTGAVTDVVENLKVNWDSLQKFTKAQIQDEIEIAIKQDWAGSQRDISQWLEVLKL